MSKVFISYSWSSEATVLALATKLRKESGIDVVLDHWEVKEGHDLYAFMEKMVTDTSIKKVLIVCDQEYAQKANDRTGGVGAESQIISPEIYRKTSQEKFIPVALAADEAGQPIMPVYLKGRVYIDFSTAEKMYKNYEKLLRAILDKPLHEKPALGKTPALPAKTEHISTTRFHFERATDALIENKPQARAFARDYLRRKTEGLETFRLPPERTHDYDDLVLQAIKDMLSYRDEVLDFASTLIEFANEADSNTHLTNLIQQALQFNYPVATMTSWTTLAFDNYKFWTYEVFLYLIALFIKAQRFDQANQFLSQEFFVESPHESHRFLNYTHIRPYLESLEAARMRRLKLDRASITADLLHERSTREDIKFTDLAEADLILYFRSYLNTPSTGTWAPWTAIYRGAVAGPSKLFRMAESNKHFANLKILLGATQQESGLELLQRFSASGGKMELSMQGVWPISLSNFAQFHKLGTRP